MSTMMTLKRTNWNRFYFAANTSSKQAAIRPFQLLPTDPNRIAIISNTF